MALIKIMRNAGESEADFKRRYNREYRHAYYHAKQKHPRKPRVSNPKPGLISKKYNILRREGEDEREFQKRADRERKRINRAIARGAPPDVSGEVLAKLPRKLLGVSEEEMAQLARQPGETLEAWKKRDASERTKRYRARDPDRLRTRAKTYYRANPDKEKARGKRWREENPEAYTAGQKRYLDAHPERLANLVQWGKDNPERHKAAVRAWNEQNRALLNAYSASWRKQARIATPAWSDFDQVKAFYVERRRISAETGIVHQVDHIVPLQGKLVCGLHTQRNLRVIPGAENSRKRAKLDHELLEALWEAERHLFPLPDDQV